ncbi:hypothetical protein SAMN02745883_01553 [Caminicella sporogenes DSM 14501]|uniref:Uncharacterized protein n=1 Tax=Caminicella sporogenes DSM 14501 TaxID=1121266 RepID=A0A1M6QM65_9FIRM|nr:hypothetical protein [Caminicella sporogenes]RKD25268.1 hypothetical protein BET04_03370 [Caminicella sporogenes]SHK21127.1 hypothetical protein SAMN02745883_01553 [Caminicella sporogenes DSM 14501]
MNNSKRVMIFTIALMSVIILLPFILTFTYTNKTAYLQIRYSNILFFSFVIIFSLVQSLVRIFITSKYYIKDKILFSLKLSPSKLYNRLVFYFQLIAMSIIPLIKNNSFNNFSFSLLIFNFTIWITIIELFLYISYKYTKVYFMTDGILIRGLDLRMDLPINDDIRSHSGFYPYFDIENFTIKNNILKLQIYGNRGYIEVIIPSDKIKHIKTYLESKKIYCKNAH